MPAAEGQPPQPQSQPEPPQPEAAAGDEAEAPAPELPPEPVHPVHPVHPVQPDQSAQPAQAEAEAPASKTPVNIEELARTVEALLFAAEEPLAVREIARAAGAEGAPVHKALKLIKAACEEQHRPWELAEVAGGYRLVTKPEFYPAIQRLNTQTRERKLTQAALETLALIAYRQPIGRADIESIRGVACGPVLRQLLDKNLIKIAGRSSGLGHALLYGTGSFFLEHFGLKSIEELPKPGELKPQ